MGKASISMAKGKGSLAHNNRDFIADNVDIERLTDNRTFVCQSLEDAYEECFGDAIRAYNDGQKRSDRRIDGAKGYMEKIRTSKNGEKLYYENVVQIGNLVDSYVGSEQGGLCAKILEQYVEDFKERNPHLHLFNAVLHMDERTPHLHLDYIPVAEGYKKGMNVRNSLDKALKQQGIDGKANKYENSTIQWQKREKDYIETLMKPYGIERKEESGLSREHMTVEQYKAVAELTKNELEAGVELDIEATRSRFSDTVKMSTSDFESLKERAKLSTLHDEALRTVLESRDDMLDSASSSARMLKANAERSAAAKLQDAELYRKVAKSEAESAMASNLSAEEQEKIALDVRELYEKKYAEQKELNERYEKLKADYDVLGSSVIELRDDNKKLQKKVETMESRLKEVSRTMLEVVQALSCFRYGKDTYKDYRLSLTDLQSGLMEAMERTAISAFEKVGMRDMAKQAREKYGLSDGIRSAQRSVDMDRKKAEEDRMRASRAKDYGRER